MEIRYIDGYKRLVIDGEDTLIIPTNKSKAVINIDTDSLNIMNKKHDINICLTNFYVNGTKPTIKEKFKMIFRIAML